MLKLLESEAMKLEKEKSMYEDYLSIPDTEPPTEEECTRLEKVLEGQRAHERMLEESLLELDKQLDKATRELEFLDNESKDLDKKEEQ